MLQAPDPKKSPAPASKKAAVTAGAAAKNAKGTPGEAEVVPPETQV